MNKRVELLDFSVEPPKLKEEALLDKVRKAFKKINRIHVFFLGAKIRVIRNDSYQAVDNAFKDIPAFHVNTYDINRLGQPYVERKIVAELQEKIREYYGDEDIPGQSDAA